MEAPKMQVKCSVENCYYYKDHKCYANGLEINTMGDMKAETSDGTCCTTFRKENTSSF